MGPPLISGGNGTINAQWKSCDSASMGPPLISGGNLWPLKCS